MARDGTRGSRCSSVLELNEPSYPLAREPIGARPHGRGTDQDLIRDRQHGLLQLLHVHLGLADRLDEGAAATLNSASGSSTMPNQVALPSPRTPAWRRLSFGLVPLTVGDRRHARYRLAYIATASS